MNVCAIVDAYSSGSLLAPIFAKKGYKVIHVSSTENIPALYVHSYHKEDFYAEIPALPIEEQIELLRSYKVEFIVTGSELGVEHTDLLNHTMSLPGNEAEKSHARRNKYEMVDTIAKAGIKTAQQIKATQPAEAHTFAQQLPTYDIILKPQRSAATDLVFRAKNEEEANQAFRRIVSQKSFFNEPNTEVCIQEFLVGSEYVVDTVSRDGQHAVTDMWKYYLTSANGVPFLYDYEELLTHNDPVVAELKDYALRVIDALGIKWGAAHTEIMLTKDGPVVIEVGARLAGMFPKTVKTAIGRGPADVLVDAYVDPEAFYESQRSPYSLDTHCILIDLIASDDGVLEELSDIDSIEALSSFQYADITVKPGDRIRKTVDIPTSPGSVCLAHTDPSIVRRDYEILRELERSTMYKFVSDAATVA